MIKERYRRWAPTLECPQADGERWLHDCGSRTSSKLVPQFYFKEKGRSTEKLKSPILTLGIPSLCPDFIPSSSLELSSILVVTDQLRRYCWRDGRQQGPETGLVVSPGTLPTTLPPTPETSSSNQHLGKVILNPTLLWNCA